MILFISAGQEVTRKNNTSINRRNMYLNYGLLGIATYFSNKGYPCLQVQGHFFSPLEFFEKYRDAGYYENNYPIFISIPSFYALSWVRKIVELFRSSYKDKKIIVGGRWVIDGEIEKLTDEIGFVDYIADGLGEGHFNFLEEKFLKRFEVGIKRKNYLSLDYDILENRKIYQPSVEVSRGCGMGCAFCQEKDQPLGRLLEPDILCDQLEDILLTDDYSKMTPYFEASMFIPSKSWSEKFSKAVIRRPNLMGLEWRTESRVDSINPDVLPYLRSSGLRVVDLGLESASLLQLERMSKTQNPKKYLERASLILREAKNNDIRVKVNILLYAGETEDTLNETREWLYRHKDCIFGVSVGPVVVYGWENKVFSYLEELKMMGASLAGKNSIRGVQQINLSSSIDHEYARYISREISREFMNAKNFFELKKFSYFSRNYKYEEFLDDLKKEDLRNLSFSIN